VRLALRHRVNVARAFIIRIRESVGVAPVRAILALIAIMDFRVVRKQFVSIVLHIITPCKYIVLLRLVQLLIALIDNLKIEINGFGVAPAILLHFHFRYTHLSSLL